MNTEIPEKKGKAMRAIATGCCAMLLASCASREAAAPPQKVIEKTTIEKTPQKPKTVIVQQSPKPAPQTKTKTNVTVEVKPAPNQPTSDQSASAARPSASAPVAPQSTPVPKPATQSSSKSTTRPKPAHEPKPTANSKLTKPTAQPSPKSAASKSQAPKKLTVRAEVIATSKMPDPQSVPYKDALIFTKYKVLEVENGEYNRKEILVAQWGMKDKKLQPAARRKVGDVQTLSLEPLARRSDLESVMRSDDTGEYNIEPYFAE